MELLNKKILIVDDDEFLLGIYAKNFKDEGFDVQWEEQGGALGVGSSLNY